MDPRLPFANARRRSAIASASATGPTFHSALRRLGRRDSIRGPNRVGRRRSLLLCQRPQGDPSDTQPKPAGACEARERESGRVSPAGEQRKRPGVVLAACLARSLRA